MNRTDFGSRDENGSVAFYVLLWRRRGISLHMFDEYWRNVHGPVCARLPGQYQYWQFHLAHAEGGIWPDVAGVESRCPDEQQFDGIAELTFRSEDDRNTWFRAAAILMDDEHNVFRKAIGYNSSPGNSKTYVDRIPSGDPNGPTAVSRLHVMVKKADGASTDAFRHYLTSSFARHVTSSDHTLKLRLHLFEEVDGTRPDAAGVAHSEPRELNYQAAFEIAFSNPFEMERFFSSEAFAAATADQAKYVKQMCPFPERSAYTFVYESEMTLAGQRSATVAELIRDIGAVNQVRSDVTRLMLGQAFTTKVKGA